MTSIPPHYEFILISPRFSCHRSLILFLFYLFDEYMSKYLSFPAFFFFLLPVKKSICGFLIVFSL